MFEGSRKKEKIKKEIRNEREKIARIGRTSRRRSRIIVLYVVVAGTTTYQRVGCRRNRAVADEATSTLALRYHDLDFSAPRVSIAPCLHFVHALFRPDYNTPRLAASLSLQIYIYISLSLSLSFAQLTKDVRTSAFVTRLPDRVTDSPTLPLRNSLVACRSQFFHFLNECRLRLFLFLPFFSAKNLLCKLRSNFSTKISSFRKTLRNNFIVFPVQNEFWIPNEADSIATKFTPFESLGQFNNFNDCRFLKFLKKEEIFVRKNKLNLLEFRFGNLIYACTPESKKNYCLCTRKIEREKMFRSCWLKSLNRWLNCYWIERGERRESDLNRMWCVSSRSFSFSFFLFRSLLRKKLNSSFDRIGNKFLYPGGN